MNEVKTTGEEMTDEDWEQRIRNSTKDAGRAMTLHKAYLEGRVRIILDGVDVTEADSGYGDTFIECVAFYLSTISDMVLHGEVSYSEREKWANRFYSTSEVTGS
jgi:hypothetical protein